MASTSAAAPTSKGKAVAGPAQVKKAVRTHQFEPGVSLLPISRVHRIIKADKDIKLCSKEAIFLISKATVSHLSLTIDVKNERFLRIKN